MKLIQAPTLNISILLTNKHKVFIKAIIETPLKVFFTVRFSVFKIMNCKVVGLCFSHEIKTTIIFKHLAKAATTTISKGKGR